MDEWLGLQDVFSGPYRTTTDEDNGFYRTAKDPLEVDEEGIEMSSAPVALGHISKHGKEIVQRTTSDQEQASPPGLVILYNLAWLQAMNIAQEDQSLEFHPGVRLWKCM